MTHGYQYLADTADTKIQITQKDVGFDTPAPKLGDAELQSVLGTVYAWAGIICVVIIIVGGIRYTTANGDPGKVKAGKDTILYAIVGLVVILMASLITQFVIQRTAAPAAGTGGTSQSPPPNGTGAKTP